MSHSIEAGKDFNPKPKAEKDNKPEAVQNFNIALDAVEDIVLKSYLSQLGGMAIVEKSGENNDFEATVENKICLIKIHEMVYEKDEFALYKFESVFNALEGKPCTVSLIIDSDGQRADFYMGVRVTDETDNVTHIADIIESALSGQFPGIITTRISLDSKKKILDAFEPKKKPSGALEDKTLVSVSGVANGRDKDIKDNRTFIQGLEKLTLAMRGKMYTAIVLAKSTSQSELSAIRDEYEEIYTSLSLLAKYQLSYNVNESTTHSETNQWNAMHSESKDNTAGRVLGAVSSAASIAGGIIVTAASGGAGAPLGAAMVGAGVGTGVLGALVKKSMTDGVSLGGGKMDSETTGQGQGIMLNVESKKIVDILKRIDTQLERLQDFESMGMWECAAYFLSPESGTAEAAAANYKSIMRGEQSGVELSAINCWTDPKKVKELTDYISVMEHPVFCYNNESVSFKVSPCSLVSGKELAIHMGLPRKSVCGLPVIEHAVFGKDVVKYREESREESPRSGINLGEIFNMGSTIPNSKVMLDKDSLSMHTFVTGSTGSGKSNTIYELIRQSKEKGATFLVIEPTKGEYKHVFGNRSDVAVYGTNPRYSDLLRINPFRFPKKTHILEHVDRLVEIFNVCWPMYAAMPAVLKEALLLAYEECGWDFNTSLNNFEEDIFPTFTDLQEALVREIRTSAYSDEVKSNYEGSLVTRVSSLTNGLNGQIFSANEISDEDLFDRNAIIDLSRIGSLETKSLIMGVLIMRMSEYRMSSSDDMNIPFKHLTVLEEAHDILKRTSTEQVEEGSNITGKSVEMISNAIAEMRTYGEGFVIVDQSPNAVDLSAIRNTNTKIIMRLPEEADRRLAGKSAGLKDEQLDEIAKLPRGVAVVYQNDWVEPVLCGIKKYNGKEERFRYDPVIHLTSDTDRLRKMMLQLLLKTRVKNPVDVNVDDVERLVEHADMSGMSARSRLRIKRIVDEYKKSGKLEIWQDEKFEELSGAVEEVLDASIWTEQIMSTAEDLDELTNLLIRQVEKRAPGLQRKYSLGAVQCLQKRRSIESDKASEVYGLWVAHLVNKGMI